MMIALADATGSGADEAAKAALLEVFAGDSTQESRRDPRT
jgi:hypothetical protein